MIVVFVWVAGVFLAYTVACCVVRLRFLWLIDWIVDIGISGLAIWL